MGKPLRETLRHRNAFDYYYSLGDARSVAQVGQKFGVSKRAVENWSLAFEWEKRIRERDKVIADRLSKKSEDAIVKMQERQVRIAQMVQGAFAKRLVPFIEVDGKKVPNPDLVKVDAADFVRSAELEGKLLGFRPDGAGATAQDIQDLISTIVYVLQTKLSDVCPHCRTARNEKNEIADELERVLERFTRSQGEQAQGQA